MIFNTDVELRKKNLRTILEFMTDEDDTATGEQKRKRLNRYKLYAPGGQGYRYGAGYTLQGARSGEGKRRNNRAPFPSVVYKGY